MSETAAQLIATFDSLPAQDQHELLAEMLRRSGELPEAMLADNHLTGLADELFHALDRKESNAHKSSEK